MVVTPRIKKPNVLYFSFFKIHMLHQHHLFFCRYVVCLLIFTFFCTTANPKIPTQSCRTEGIARVYPSIYYRDLKPKKDGNLKVTFIGLSILEANSHPVANPFEPSREVPETLAPLDCKHLVSGIVPEKPKSPKDHPYRRRP